MLRTNDPALLPVVTSLLESSGVPYFVQGATAMGVLPLGLAGGHPLRTRLGAVIHVPADREAEVLELLAGAGLAPLPPDDEEADAPPPVGRDSTG